MRSVPFRTDGREDLHLPPRTVPRKRGAGSLTMAYETVNGCLCALVGTALK
jgi:hypothetical protein